MQKTASENIDPISHVGMTCFPKPAILGTPTLTRVGSVGHGRHGGEALAMWGGPMMSALILSPFLIKEKGQEYRSHRCPRLNPPPFGHPNPPGPLSRGNGGRLGMTWLLIPEEKREKSTRNPPKFRIFEA